MCWRSSIARLVGATVLVVAVPSMALAADMDLRGAFGTELRVFPGSPLFGAQHGHVGLSMTLEPEIGVSWAQGDWSFVVTPFLRLDQHDSERTHVDIRRAMLIGAFGDFELRLGVGRVFHGVTESRHEVDIVNQTDQVENLDGEDKLGQPMVGLTWDGGDAGVFELLAMVGFRQRNYPGQAGRLRGPLLVDADRAVIEHPLGEGGIDGLFRWSHSVGDWDLALGYFYGSSRQPRLLAELLDTGPVLVPHYELIHQVGTELQWTIEGLLTKVEAIARMGQGNAFAATTAGFEYTFSGLGSTDLDLGVLAEYSYDGRSEDQAAFGRHAAFGGMRLVINDAADTTLLAGASVNPETGAVFVSVEASRRLGDQWRLALEGRAFLNAETGTLLDALRRDSYIQAELSYYF